MKFVYFALLAGMAYAGPCRIKSDKPKVDYIREPLKYVDDMPDNWAWYDVNNTNFLTNVRNQHLPSYCGSCWAMAATTVLSDRIKIARGAQWPDINIAPQVLISCSGDDGCHGGEAYNALEWMNKNEASDETCAIYRARGHDNGEKCSSIIKCETCDPDTLKCYTPDSYKIYHTDEYGHIKGEEAMMQEIYQRGPIACGMAVTDAFLNYTGGIFHDTTGNVNIDHDISIVGFGVDAATGTKYWVGQNSWGTYWGEQGLFKLVRGINNLAIESECAWATPLDTWTKDVRHNTTEEEKKESMREPMISPAQNFLDKPFKACRTEKASFTTGEKPPAVHSWDEIDVKDLPANWDWGNMGTAGKNYLSWSKNQHIPVYCGSCWAEGPTSALADRFNIMTNLSTQVPIALNAQVLINCHKGGNCEGGNPGGVYEYAYTQGIPDSSCEQYVALDLRKQFDGPDKHLICDDKDLCRDCRGDPCPVGETCQKDCFAVPFKKYYAKTYYNVRGADKMKAEIYKNGPIGCGIDATDNFEKYTGGIYSEKAVFPMINHEISVVGWGTDEKTGEEFWWGRNSWGTYWGVFGYFQILMHKNNLGIETDCIAAEPSFTASLEETIEAIIQ